MRHPQRVDIPPTVVGAVGGPLPPGVQREPFPHVDHGSLAAEDVDPFLVARYGEHDDRSIRVLDHGTYELISTSRGEHMLFDLARDPQETQDLAAREFERPATPGRRLEAALGVLHAAAMRARN
jgi:hypothetical protein